MNVVGQWRERGRALRAQYWRCSECGRFSAVQRAACSGCGSRKTPVAAELPASLVARGWSHSHLVIETMDQTLQARPVMLMELPGGETLPMELASADRAHASELVGQKLRVVLRRVRSNGADGPIVYGRKVAADPQTRVALLKNTEQ